MKRKVPGMWYGALDEADPTELVEPELEAQRRARVAALLDAASIQESGLSTELRYLADGITGFSAWVVRHASEEPNIAGDIVNVVMGSARACLASARARARSSFACCASRDATRLPAMRERCLLTGAHSQKRNWTKWAGAWRPRGPRLSACQRRAPHQ